MLCIISDTSLLFTANSLFLFFFFFPSHFPSKPLLEIVVKDKPNSLLTSKGVSASVFLTTKIPGFFFCFVLHLPVPSHCQKKWTFPQALVLSPQPHHCRASDTSSSYSNAQSSFPHIGSSFLFTT